MADRVPHVGINLALRFSAFGASFMQLQDHQLMVGTQPPSHVFHLIWAIREQE